MLLPQIYLKQLHVLQLLTTLSHQIQRFYNRRLAIQMIFHQLLGNFIKEEELLLAHLSENRENWLLVSVVYALCYPNCIVGWVRHLLQNQTLFLE